MFSEFANGIPPRRNQLSASLQAGRPGLQPPRQKSGLSAFGPAQVGQSKILSPAASRLLLLEGARVREAIQISVSLADNSRKAIVSFAWVILVERGNARVLTKITTKTTINKSPDVKEKPDVLNIETSGRDEAMRPLPCINKAVNRDVAQADLRVFNAM